MYLNKCNASVGKRKGGVPAPPHSLLLPIKWSEVNSLSLSLPPHPPSSENFECLSIQDCEYIVHYIAQYIVHHVWHTSGQHTKGTAHSTFLLPNQATVCVCRSNFQTLIAAFLLTLFTPNDPCIPISGAAGPPGYPPSQSHAAWQPGPGFCER